MWRLAPQATGVCMFGLEDLPPPPASSVQWPWACYLTSVSTSSSIKWSAIVTPSETCTVLGGLSSILKQLPTPLGCNGAIFSKVSTIYWLHWPLSYKQACARDSVASTFSLSGNLQLIMGNRVYQEKGNHETFKCHQLADINDKWEKRTKAGAFVTAMYHGNQW